MEIKCQLDATDDFYCRSYCLLNMFRAPLCPSSGAREYYTGDCWLWYLVLWFSSCRYGVELSVMCPVCGLLPTNWTYNLHLEGQTLLLIGMLDPENESRTVLQIVSNFLPDYRVLHHTKLESFIVYSLSLHHAHKPNVMQSNIPLHTQHHTHCRITTNNFYKFKNFKCSDSNKEPTSSLKMV